MEKKGLSEPAPPYMGHQQPQPQFLQPVPNMGQQQQFFGPPPTVFNAQQGPPPTVVQIVQVPIADQLRDKSTQIKCPKCLNDVQTRVQFENGRMTHIAVAVLCFIGCWCGCCLIPCCIDACKDVQHECPNCNHFIGNYRR